jgi:hypothetical protein
MHMLKIWPLFLLLGGCAMDANSLERTSPEGVAVRVSKMDLLQNTNELTPQTGWFGSSDQELKQALRSTATSVCAPGSVLLVDVDRPDYIKVAMTPRGYVHCQ